MISLLRFFVLSLMSNKEHVLSPMSFGLSLVLLLAVGTSALPEDAKITMYPTLLFVIGLIVLSWMLLKHFHTFAQEHTLTTLLLHPFKPLAIALTFGLIILTINLITFIGLGWLLAAMLGLSLTPGWLGALTACLPPYLLGMVPLGVLCCLLTTITPASTMLFPVIYFPLATPLTLASIEVYTLLWQSSAPGIEGVTSAITGPIGLLILLGGFFALLSTWLISWALTAL